MDFITWWFDEHYIWSTFLTGMWALLWSIYKGEVVRALVAFSWVVILHFHPIVTRRK